MPTRIPTHLTDPQLIDALKRCVHDERGATALLVAHLAEMDARTLHLGLGFSSLYDYCCDELRLSESATCKRIEVARAARRFPVLLERLADGSLSLSSARLLAPKLTGENHRELIAAAAGRRKRAVDEMLARRFPKPDVTTLVRKLPTRAGATLALPPADGIAGVTAHAGTAAESAPAGAPALLPIASGSAPASVTPPAAQVPPASPPRPLATPLSADRYQIRFTASAETWKKLQVARELLRHTVPSGDAGEIVVRALTALIDDLARKKLAVVKKPARRPRATAAGSRHIPAKVKRAVWRRDKGRCAFVADSGRRCEERGRLELHHVEPYAVGGAATVANIQLRCRAHNAYEATVYYGSNGKGSVGVVSERPMTYGIRGRALACGLSANDSTGPGAGWNADRRVGGESSQRRAERRNEGT